MFTPAFSCHSGKKAHELCLVFILRNYTGLNTSNNDVVIAVMAVFPAHLQSCHFFYSNWKKQFVVASL